MALLLLPVPLQAASVLVVSGTARHYQSFSSQLSDRASASSTPWEIQNDNDRFSVFVGVFDTSRLANDRLQALFHGLGEPQRASLEALCHRFEAVVTIGPEATRWVRSRCDNPMLSVLTTRAQLRGMKPLSGVNAFSAIYLEANPERNLGLVAATMPQRASVGVLVSTRTQPQVSRLRSAAETLGLRLVIIQVRSDEEAVRRLRSSIKTLDALLLLADDTINNPWSLKPILLMTARQYIPVFGGASEDYVKAGVTAAVVSDNQGLLDQTLMSLDLLVRNIVPKPSYPTDTRLTINAVVAKALSVNVEQLRNHHGR